MLELAGKLILSDGQTDELPLSQGIVWKPQVLDALTSLGWSEKDASAAIDAYVQHNPAAETEPVGVALRGVLASWVLRTRWAATKRRALFDVSHSNFCERRIL